MPETNSMPPAKPSKPYPEFPLRAHAAGQWCKKIRGKTHYFGKLSDPDTALKEYLRVKDDLHAGKKPRPDPNAVRVKDVCNAFLICKKALVAAGELSLRTWAGYKIAADMVVNNFGKTRLVDDIGTDDFAALRNKMAAKWGVHGLARTIQAIRSIFKHAYDIAMIDKPMRFGPGFKRPSKQKFRQERAKQGPKLFDRDDILRLLDAAGTSIKAMLLLAINCGFGNSDCASLPLFALNLETGWIDFPRPKTGIPRRCPLWPETVEALKDVLANRHEPKSEDHAGLVFITKYGDSWGKDTSTNPISQETAKLLRKLHIGDGRKGLGFYTLRHVFRTVADESKDQPAVDFIMGHESAHMSSVYRETISSERLKVVVEHVHRWLFTSVEQSDVIPMVKAN